MRWILFVTLIGCSSSVGEYCEEYVDCLDGNETDEAACAQNMANERRLSQVYGCIEDYQEYSKCMLEEAECESMGGQDYWSPGEDCADETSDLLQCIEKASDIVGGSGNGGGGEDTGWGWDTGWEW